MRVAFQGERGAYGEEALRRHFGADADPVPCPTFPAVEAALLAGAADRGVIPVENLLVGSVTPGHDLLSRGRLHALGEVVVPVRHCLLGRPGVGLAGIRRVLSHPVALAQCESFLARHPRLVAIAAHDTAGAAREVAEGGSTADAAIASRAAGALYGLEVVAADVGDRPDNHTRFLVVAPNGAAPPAEPAEGAANVSLLMATLPHRPGALAALLSPLARAGLNLATLTARPAGAAGAYHFLLEVQGDASEAPLRTVLEALPPGAGLVRVLGRWRRDAGAAATRP
jgi:prephenate dehydratase